MITYWYAKPAAFLGDCDAIFLTLCDLAVNVLGKLINIMVFSGVVLYGRKCGILKLLQYR